MITPGSYAITVWQGADYDKTFTVTQNGSAINWTGYQARMQVREAADSTAYLLSLTDGNGITLGGTAGTIAVVVTGTQTSLMSAGSYAYDLELVSSGNQVTRLLQGSFNVVGNVTR